MCVVCLFVFLCVSSREEFLRKAIARYTIEQTDRLSVSQSVSLSVYSLEMLTATSDSGSDNTEVDDKIRLLDDAVAVFTFCCSE